MVWILLLVGLVGALVYGAHRLLAGVCAFSSIGHVGVVARGLIYAAAVVVGSQGTDAAINIHQVTSRGLGLASDDKAQAIAQVLSTHAANMAWQAGLLVAASTLLASASGRRARSVQ